MSLVVAWSRKSPKAVSVFFALSQEKIVCISPALRISQTNLQSTVDRSNRRKEINVIGSFETRFRKIIHFKIIALYPVFRLFSLPFLLSGESRGGPMRFEEKFKWDQKCGSEREFSIL
jgi:hypothetical protein